MQKTFEWDGICPEGFTVEELPEKVDVKPIEGPPKPCPRKVCRLGDKECDQYHSCRDTCRIQNERITAMEKCPDD